MADDKVRITITAINQVQAPLQQALGAFGAFATNVSERVERTRAAVQRFNTELGAGVPQKAAAAKAALSMLHNEVGRGQSAIRSMTGSLVAMAGAYMGVQGIQRLGKSFLDTSMSAEMMKSSIEAATGSAEKAEKTFNMMLVTARKMPFTFMEIAQAGTVLSNFDRNFDLEGWIKPFLDVSAKLKMAGPHLTLQEISANFGKAYSGYVGEAELFRNYGINNVIKEVAKLKFGVDDLGKLSLPHLREAMYEAFTAGDKGIAGMTDKLAQTVPGRFSNLVDFWDAFKIRMMDSGPYERLRGELENLLNKAEEMDQSGEMDAWAERGAASVEKLMDKLQQLWKIAKSVYTFLGDNSEAVKMAGVLGGLIFAVTKLINLFTALKAAMVVFSATMGTAAAKTAVTGAAMEAAAVKTGLFSQAVKSLTLSLGVLTGAATVGLIAMIAYTDHLNRVTDEKEKWIKGSGDLITLKREMTAARGNPKNMIAYAALADVQTGRKDISSFTEAQRAEMAALQEQERDFAIRRKMLEKTMPKIKKEVGTGEYMTRYSVGSIGQEIEMQGEEITKKIIISGKEQVADALKNLSSYYDPLKKAKVQKNWWSLPEYKNIDDLLSAAAAPPDFGTGLEDREKEKKAKKEQLKFTSAMVKPYEKSGAEGRGASTEGIYALGYAMKDYGDFNRITAMNDKYAHQGRAHGLGLGMDFTLKSGKAGSKAAGEQLQALAAAAGVDIKVLNEYLNPSKKSTGPHIHAEFESSKDAKRFADFMRARMENDMDVLAGYDADRLAEEEKLAELRRKNARDHRKLLDTSIDESFGAIFGENAGKMMKARRQMYENIKLFTPAVGETAAKHLAGGIFDKEIAEINKPGEEKRAEDARKAADIAAQRRTMGLEAAAPDEFNLPLRLDELNKWRDAQEEGIKGSEQANALYAKKLEGIYTEYDAWRKQQAGRWAAYNVAQLQRMLQDERTAAEEKIQIQEEISERIAAGNAGTMESIRQGWNEAMGGAQNWSQSMLDLGRSAFEGLRSSFSDTFVAGFQGDISSLGELWGSFVQNIKMAFVRAVADMVAYKLASNIFGGLMGGGGGEGGGEAGAISTALSFAFAKGGISPGPLNIIAAARGAIFRGPLGALAQFAGGGIVNRPTLALVGEGGGPEAVVPLAGGKIPVDLRGRGGGGDQHIYVQIQAADAASINDMLARNPMVITQIAQRVVREAAPGVIANDIENNGQMRNYV